MSSNGDDGDKYVSNRMQVGELGSRKSRGRGLVNTRTGRPAGPRHFERQNPTPALTREEEERRAQREKRFSDPQASPTTSTTDWSAAVWKEKTTSVDPVGRDTNAKPMRGTQPRSVIGLGRATGLSRVPDAALSRSPELMESLLADLISRTKQLEDGGYALVSIGTQVNGPTSSSKAIEAWESILGGFRQLTMAITASPLEDVKSLPLRIYEAAADACLLGGNLSFYLACQSRLLSDIYVDHPTDTASVRRRDEFTGYSLLYFGVFCVDNRELATIMRRMSPQTFASPFVTFGLTVLVAFRNRDAAKFITLFNNSCSIRQKTILSSSLDSMRKIALSTIIRSYLALDKYLALSLVGLQSESDFLNLLKAERPDLVENNTGASAEYQFRSRRSSSGK